NCCSHIGAPSRLHAALFILPHDSGAHHHPHSLPTRRSSDLTVHTTANHPVVVAKQIATMDQISQSRVGLNIVAGWNKPEYEALGDRKSTRLNSSHVSISYAVFCLKKKKDSCDTCTAFVASYC